MMGARRAAQPSRVSVMFSEAKGLPSAAFTMPSSVAAEPQTASVMAGYGSFISDSSRRMHRAIWNRQARKECEETAFDCASTH